MRKSQRTNFRVEVYPRDAGDFGGVYIGSITATEREQRQACEEIADQIRRHVDGLPSRGNRGVDVVSDPDDVCSFCGRQWTEESDAYNGGCCDADQANDPDPVPEAKP